MLILSALTPILAADFALAATPATEPASWVTHDLKIDLYNLPQRYSCDDLRYKFRDVLLALGARPDLKVLTTRCELGSRSPGVRLQFSTPEIVDSTSKRGPVVDSAATIVRLEPGHPASLYAADCELMRQIKDRLLAPIARVRSFSLACSAAPSRGARFSVSVQTLQPLESSGARVATERDPPRKRLD